MVEKIRTTPPRLRLGTLGEIKSELAKVYREARAGRLPWHDATRACHLLHTLARLTEAEGEAERRARAEQESHEILEAHGLIGANGKLVG